MTEVLEGGFHLVPFVVVRRRVENALASIAGRPLKLVERSTIESALNEYAMCRRMHDTVPRSTDARMILKATEKAIRVMLKVANKVDLKIGDDESSRVLREAVSEQITPVPENGRAQAVVRALLAPPEVLQAAANACDQALDALTPTATENRQGKGGGQRGNPYFRVLVCELANVFVTMGLGKPTRSWDEKARAEIRLVRVGAYRPTPFFKFVRAAQLALPPNLRVKGKTTCGDMIDEALRIWQETGRR